MIVTVTNTLLALPNERQSVPLSPRLPLSPHPLTFSRRCHPASRRPGAFRRAVGRVLRNQIPCYKDLGNAIKACIVASRSSLPSEYPEVHKSGQRATTTGHSVEKRMLLTRRTYALSSETPAFRSSGTSALTVDWDPLRNIACRSGIPVLPHRGSALAGPRRQQRARTSEPCEASRNGRAPVRAALAAPRDLCASPSGSPRAPRCRLPSLSRRLEAPLFTRPDPLLLPAGVWGNQGERRRRRGGAGPVAAACTSAAAGKCATLTEITCHLRSWLLACCRPSAIIDAMPRVFFHRCAHSSSRLSHGS